LTVLPAKSSLAANALPQAHCTLIGIGAGEYREKSAKLSFCTATRISAMKRRSPICASRPISRVEIPRLRN
jgi:hypothetical protein